MKHSEARGRPVFEGERAEERIAFRDIARLQTLYEDFPQKVLRCIGDGEKAFGPAGDVQSFVRHVVTKGTIPEHRPGERTKEAMAKEINSFLSRILQSLAEKASQPQKVFGKEYFSYPRGRRVEPVRQEDIDRRRQGAAHADPYYFGAYGDDDDVED